MLRALLILLVCCSLIAEEFAVIQFEYHPCITNQIDIDSDFAYDTNGLPVYLWYFATNTIKWNADAGHIYIPEWSFDINYPTNWISNCYFSTNVSGILETKFFSYVINENPVRFYRIRKEERQLEGGPVMPPPEPEKTILFQ